MSINKIIKSLLAFFGFGQSIAKSPSIDTKLRIDIDKGFQIRSPNIFVPWGIDEKTLTELFEGQKLKHVTSGYYTASCTSLDNLKCMIGFHFEPRSKGKLKELEFFRNEYKDQQKSFDDFQRCFSGSFGEPTITTKGTDGFNNYEWRLNNIQIVHFVFDRFGPEEHMRIKKLK
jgi:hypothetical protein